MAASCSFPQTTRRVSVRRLLLVCVSLLAVLFPAVRCAERQQLYSYRPHDVTRATEEGAFVVQTNTNTSLLLFGRNLTNDTIVKFTTDDHHSCDADDDDAILGGNVVVGVGEEGGSLDVLFTDTGTFYFCLFESRDDELGAHQGSSWLVKIVVVPPTSKKDFLPLPVEILLIIFLMVLSGMFSGLNLGLMALDPTTLKIIMKSGTKWQRRQAITIYRVRKHGNYLLCTLLLGNVLVNSTLTVLLDDVLGSGLYAVVASTISIVIFGEIIPQAICSRHGLFVGYVTIWLTYIFMVLTFPLAFPLSMILNCILGKEIGSVYKREQLLELLKVTEEHHGLEKDEVNIISGVLVFKKKTAEEVMTNFEDIYCLDIEGVLDFSTMRDIYDSGFSRIPVYEGEKQNIIGLLYVRDLAFVDPDDETPLSSVLKFYKHEVRFVFNDIKLDEILQEFAEGNCHMAIVQKVVTETEGDPFYEVVGVVTLEDIVEEILQREIVDETDRFMDNRTLKPRERKHVDVGDFVDPGETPTLSAQQRLALYQYLSSSVSPFHEDYISQNVLKCLLKKNIVRSISFKESQQKNYHLYKAGSPASYFTLILEGCVQVHIGKEGLEFEGKSFSCYGAKALEGVLESSEHPPEYIPDFTVQPATDCQVVMITRRQYLAAYKATIFERENQQQGGTPGGTKQDVFTAEWESAESSDIEMSQRAGSGLSPITKFLPKKPPPGKRRRRKRNNSIPDQHCLLSSSTTSARSTDSAEGRQLGQWEGGVKLSHDPQSESRELQLVSHQVHDKTEKDHLRTSGYVGDWTIRNSSEV